MSVPIRRLTTLQRPVFLLNSRLSRFTATSKGCILLTYTTPEAALLPKLQAHFAEFLNVGYLERLGILFPPTCVGLRYGYLYDW